MKGLRSIEGPAGISVVMVAPYSPVHSPISAPGAAKKIRGVARAISAFSQSFIFINSAHNESICEGTRLRPGIPGNAQFGLSVEPFKICYRPVGKLFNALAARNITSMIAGLNPSLVWLYNPGVFEVRTGMYLKSMAPLKLVLEIEDLPTARQRGLFNIKPRLDQLYMRRILPHCDLVTCVNETLLSEITPLAKKVLLLPGFVEEGLDALAHIPFSSVPYTLGYFGGLESEKGAEVMLELATQLPPDWNFVVCGTGTFSAEFELLARSTPSRMRFFTKLSDSEIAKLMAQCDALLNPHKPLRQFGNGIFPFKVIEYLATERVVISTPLTGLSCLQLGSYMTYGGSLQELVRAVESAPGFYQENHESIKEFAMYAKNKYSACSLGQTVFGILFPEMQARHC